MDDFRVGYISPYDPDRRPEHPGVAKRRKEKRAESLESQADEFVATSEASEAESGEEPVQDYYEPSGRTEESE